ncbi:MAG: glycosyltransferase [Alphaproteobacteria bacterium]|nr:glycosyltransferase [Alphaproteobacteria bacterium]
MRAGRHLVLFARMPRLGVVKRRLAAGIGDLAALAFYRLTLTRVLRRLGRGPWRCWIAVTPPSARHLRWPRPWQAFAQSSGDLGRRMARAVAERPVGPVVIVGSDIPAIVPAHIDAAFRALGRADVVFGAARDGGYWLIGCRRRPALPNLFDRVRWSSAHALADTLRNVGRRDVIVLGDQLEDVDDMHSYERWRRAERRHSKSGT